MISIAIVEDEEMYAKQLQQFLHQYEKENKIASTHSGYTCANCIGNIFANSFWWN